jgi:hypothetical protein
MQAQRRMTYFDGVRHDCCSRDTNYNIDLPICYQQAAQHPFLTGEPFDGPFKPQPEIPRTPVSEGLAMEHRVGSGHWFGAGLSPQVSMFEIRLCSAVPVLKSCRYIVRTQNA